MQSCRWTHVEGRPQVPCEYLECDRASVQRALMRPTTRPQMMASFGTGRWCHGHIGVVQSVDKLGEFGAPAGCVVQSTAEGLELLQRYARVPQLAPVSTRSAYRITVTVGTDGRTGAV